MATRLHFTVGVFAVAFLAITEGCAAPDGSSRDGSDPSLPDRKRNDSTTSETTGTPTDGNDVPGGDRPFRRSAVAFVHGTSDHGNAPDLKCSGTGADWHCVSTTAVADYWTQPTIDSERTAADGKTLRPYVVIGCPLSAMTPWPNPTPVLPKNGAAEPGSAACVAAEIAQFVNGPDGKPETGDDIQDIVLITHSGGSNVVRYILQQHSANAEFARVHSVARGFIGIAAPSEGTYLADRVFGFGILSLGNSLFNAGYEDDGVDFIQTAKMAAWNKDPAKLVNLDKDVAGVPSFMASGSFPDASGDAEKVACGGESETKGLNKLHALYLGATDPETFRDGCSDGFITCQSAMALTNGDESRVVFGMLGKKEIGKTHFRAHNQSRRSCDGLDVDIRNKVNAIYEGSATNKTFNALSGASTDAIQSRYVAKQRVLSTHAGSIGLERSIIATTGGGEVRVRVSSTRPPTAAFLRDPANELSLPATFEHSLDGSTYAVAQLPADARAGAWMMHVVESEADHLETRLPVTVSRSSGIIASTHATVDHEAAIVHLQIVTRGARTNARLGAHATLVNETSRGEAFKLSIGQASVSASSGDQSVLTIDLPMPLEATFEHLVIRDVSLVSHDDASTLDLRERIDVN